MRRVTLFTGWQRTPEAEATTADELRAALSRLRVRHAGQNILIRLVDDAGDELMVGLGSDVGLVAFTPASRRFVAQARVGSPPPAGGPEVAFAWFDDWAYMPQAVLVPVQAVRRIAERWASSGTLDDGVEWLTQKV